MVIYPSSLVVYILTYSFIELFIEQVLGTPKKYITPDRKENDLKMLLTTCSYNKIKSNYIEI